MAMPFIRIGAVADSHYDVTHRFEECCRIHDWIARDMEERGVDLTVHTGDVHEKASRIEERNASAAFFRRRAECGPVIIVRGNHDVPRDLAIMGELANVHVLEEPGVFEHWDSLKQLGVSVPCLPWPRKANLLAALGRDVPHEEAGLVAQEALRDVLRGLGNEAAKSGNPVVLASHAMARGSVTSTGQPLVGMDMELGLEDLALCRADAVLLGHIHKSQDWTWQRDGFDVPIIYPGSPRRTAYGETEPKGYVLLDAYRDGRVKWQCIPTPCQDMVLLEAEWNDGVFAPAFEVPPKGADVRYRYHVASDQREAAKAAATDIKRMLLDHGVERVTLDPVVRPVTRARTPEITEAQTLEDKLRCVWKARGDELPPAREERVFGKLHQLQQEAR